MRNNKFKLKRITVVSALCFSVLYTNTAFAVWPVTEEVLTPYLMGASPQSMGNGIIETLVSMNDKLAQATITANENQKNAVVSNASQAIQEQRMKNILNRIPDANACEEVTSAGGRSSAGSNTSSAKEALSENSVKMFTQANTGINEAKKNIMGRVSINVCSEYDVKYNRGGCNTIGQYPDKDKSASSLITPPLSKSDALSNKVSNQSYSVEQIEVAEAAKRNLIGNLPVEPLKNKGLEDTNEGREYLSAFSSFVSRSTAGTNAIDSVLAMKKASNVSVNSRGAKIGSTLGSTQGANLAWSDASVKNKYATLFPGTTFPDNPSEWEMLRYEIYSRYADTTGADAWQVKISSADEKETAHEQARMQALDLRLQMLQIERTEDTNILLAALLGQQLQPVDKQMLNNLKTNATRATQATK
ncbi:hypothetical protein AAHV16_23370 [Klebsiella pneumoniae]|uniref:hypothetical protein n=1 Tax=Klebsiella pneumoniae TaxID=573 RepID=UPI001298DDCA|nr:hypothetical protein [Klebsiella pneumoniae]MRD53881.1 hypothetical protein [Klebsiella pneumoniae]HBR3366881.1 hypothetical protein [Klebsiella pneumoniae]HDS9270320.1 hypothetical protein [Klebsiella pneumoniae subsp. pneumoniae]HDS9391143.1 hypothetical protein [Klebsiella pneumoniae subsp. pneumoniae]